MPKYIVVTGGVVSSLGKGITASAIGALLKSADCSVNIMKIDPYINVDAGTMRPYEHGEIFICEDGTEADLDLGNYERFVQIKTSESSTITTGKVYQKVIESERQGQYLGQTVQVIPHITDEIKFRIRSFDKENSDVCIIELGGTIGDIESIPFLEAIRQLALEESSEQIMFIHLTLVPTVASGEVKTKPTQHSIKTLMSDGIRTDCLICRSEQTLSDEVKEKLSLFCNIKKDCVFSLPDVKQSIYEIPLILESEGILNKIKERLALPFKTPKLSEWQTIIENISQSESSRTIGFVGKYLKLSDAYKSLIEAFHHAGYSRRTKINFVNINPEDLETNFDPSIFENVDGIFIPGGFGLRGIDGKIAAISYGRTKQIPTFGICLGMQCMVLEYARNVLNLENAESREFNVETTEPVIEIISNLKNLKNLGGTMRLGSSQINLNKNSKIASIYKSCSITERHRHRFEINPAYIESLVSSGLTISGTGPDDLIESLEIKDHPWFIGVQFHPEFLSSPLNPHPLFESFIDELIKIKKG